MKQPLSLAGIINPMTTTDVLASAGSAFADLVRHLPEDSWERPGLGEWDIRALVGHTSNALSTVLAYLDTPASAEDVQSPEQYYAALNTYMAASSGEIAERGRQAGQRLGDEPATAVADLLSEVLARLADEADPLVTTRAGGMRLSSYLPTRTFELVVHSLDIAAAANIPFAPPADALAETAALAARIACALGNGPQLLRAMTARASLPTGFSVLG